MKTEFLSKKKINSLVKEKINVINEDIFSDKLSVILITYNHVNYIKNSIESIINQNTNFDFELIIGDDDSNDGTREICLDYARKYPDIIKLFLHKKENKRLVLGKMSGIFQIAYNLLHSNGKYVAICSGDDFWTDSSKLQKQYDFMEKNDNFSLCYHSYFYVFENNKHSEVIKEGCPKASTMFYRNIKNKLPLSFINVIQEDAFVWFVSIFEGQFKFLDNIKSTGINTPLTSITRSTNKKIFAEHGLNFRNQIYLTYRYDLDKREIASYKLLSSISTNIKMKNFRLLINILLKIRLIDVYYGIYYRLFKFDVDFLKKI